MLKMRVIPCLDVKDGRVVKGVNFVDLTDAGDPVDQARIYDREGADELCFLDITASHEGRDTLYDVVRRTAEQCFMPLTVGGGVRTVEDIRKLMLSGADKVSINTAAVARPEFVREGAPCRRRVAGAAVALADALGEALARLWRVFDSRRGADPETSYTAKLFRRGRAKIAQKLGEEAVEAVIEAVKGVRAALTGESADLLYHLLVLWADMGLTPDDIAAELARREGTSGVAEKKARRSS